MNGQAEGPHGAPDRRHTRGRGEGVLPLSQRAIRVRRHQRGHGVQVRLTHAAPSLALDARRHLARVAPPLFQEPHLHTLAALIAEQPDRTLAELKDALGTPASLATIWRAVAALDVTVKKNGPALRTRST